MPPQSPRFAVAFRPRSRQRGTVTKLCIFVGTTVVGYLFGFLASPYGLMTEVIASGVGSVLGVYLGWKFAQWIEQRM